jgi:membrane protein required for colicin V production
MPDLRFADWNSLDWLLVAILFSSTVIGWWRGVIRTVLGLVGLLGGFVLATGNYLQFGVWMHEKHWIGSQTAADVLAFVGLLALVIIAMKLVARLMQITVKKSGLGYFDRLLGGAFGVLRGVVLGTALLILPTTVAPQWKLVSTSVLGPYFFALAHDVSSLLPRFLRFG